MRRIIDALVTLLIWHETASELQAKSACVSISRDSRGKVLWSR